MHFYLVRELTQLNEYHRTNANKRTFGTIRENDFMAHMLIVFKTFH